MRAKSFPILKGASSILQLCLSIFERSTKPCTIKINAGVRSIGERFFCAIAELPTARRRDMLLQWGKLYFKLPEKTERQSSVKFDCQEGSELK